MFDPRPLSFSARVSGFGNETDVLCISDKNEVLYLVFTGRALFLTPRVTR